MEPDKLLGNESGQPGGENGGAGGGRARRTLARGTPAGSTAQESRPGTGTQENVEPDPVVPPAFTLGNVFGKGRTPRKERITKGKTVKYETLTANGAEKIARAITGAIAKWKGDKWVASDKELEDMGDSFANMVEPFPLLSQFISTWGAPLIFAGTLGGYIGLRKMGMFIPTQQPTYQPPNRPVNAGVTPPVAAQAQQQPPQAVVQPGMTPDNGGGKIVYASAADAAPLISQYDN